MLFPCRAGMRYFALPTVPTEVRKLDNSQLRALLPLN